MRSTALLLLPRLLSFTLAATAVLSTSFESSAAAQSTSRKGDKSDSEWPKEKNDDDDEKDKAKPKDMSAVQPPPDAWDIYDVTEKEGKSYFFVGLRYRGNVIPAFMINLFIDEVSTIYTNLIGVEFDLRKDNFSLVPALSYHELGTGGDKLARQKNTKDEPQNYSVINSSMKIIYASVDLLWSTKLSKNVDFEYGAGFGLGAVFGDLQNNWVQLDPNGPLAGSNGQHYAPCPAVNPNTQSPCNRATHQDSSVDKVGNYTEKSWFNGGSKPNFWPWISVPQLGLRFKPIKNFVGRLGVGFALSGFWFGLSGEYGLERKPAP
jgi:hypothetical protein